MWWREAFVQRPPAGDRQRIRPLELEVTAGQVKGGQRLADLAAVAEQHAARPQPLQEGRDGGGPSGQRTQRLAVAAMDRPRASDAAGSEMVHQAEEERQVLRIDALFVERDEVRPWSVVRR